MARNNLHEDEKQLVSKYIGGLQSHLQDVLNLFDVWTVSEAHQRALKLEKSNVRRRSVGTFSQQRYNQSTGGPSSGPTGTGGGDAGYKKPSIIRPQDGLSSTIKCLKCGEVGHRASNCKSAKGHTGKGLLIKSGEPAGDPPFDLIHDPIYDEYRENTHEEEVLHADQGELLVTQRVCLTPKQELGDKWLRHNIFTSACTNGGKVYKLIIDSGCYEIVISEEAVMKLNLETKTHSQP